MLGAAAFHDLVWRSEVDVQRLFGTGYCFSASAPVYAMACAGTEGARTQRGMDADTITSHRIAVPSVP